MLMLMMTTLIMVIMMTMIVLNLFLRNRLFTRTEIKTCECTKNLIRSW
jgi:hypothetical protein